MALDKVKSLHEMDRTTLAEIAKTCGLPVERVQDVYSCTPIQLSMISETRNEVLVFIVSFGPAADVDKFCDALQKVVAVNPIYRTRIVKSSLGTVQVVTDEEHVTQRLSGDMEAYLRDEETYNMTGGRPLFRSAFFNRTFVAAIHHAVMDHWSWTMFLDEDVALVYLGNPPRIRPPFKDFVAYRRSIDGHSTAESFWGRRFQGAPAIFPRIEPGHQPCASTKEPRKINLEHISNGIPTYQLPYYLEAAWAITSSIYTDNDSVAYGFVMSGRMPVPDSVETTLGPTIVEIPVQVNLKRNMTVKQLIKDRATALRELQTNPDLQYDPRRIREVSDAARIASGFQMLLNIRPVLHTKVHEKSDIGFSRMVWKRGLFPLQYVCVPLDDGIIIEPRADPEVVPERQFDRIMEQFDHTLKVLTAVPPHLKLDELDLLSSHDRSQISFWNRKKHLTIELSLHEAFRARTRMQPEAMAVDAGNSSASYYELNEMSDRLAHELQRRGLLPGEPVALIFEKSLLAIIVMLGVMKAGAVGIPVDIDDSHEHKTKIINSTGAKFILISSEECPHFNHLAQNVLAVSVDSISCLARTPHPLNTGRSPLDEVAFILFGGSPKGVVLEHVCLNSTLTLLAQRFGWKPGFRIIQSTTFASNISITEIFGALLFGGCLCIPPGDASEPSLAGFIASKRVNWAVLTPSMLRMMSPNSLHCLQSVISTGEPLDVRTARDWSSVFQFFNCWGSCETSVISTVADVTPDSHDAENVGTPVGCSAWIVNPRDVNQLSPIGGVGELVMEGPNVARTYLEDNVKTPSSFIPPPKWASASGRNGSQFYRTGDLAKYNDNGSISFVGRQVNRVKVGTQTVQLEEIESVLCSCKEVQNIITSTKITMGRTQLVAVACLTSSKFSRDAVLQQSTEPGTDERLESIRTFALSKLPSYKVPTIWIAVDIIPQTASQKLDRAAVREWLKTIRC